MINLTFELRKNNGKFEAIESEYTDKLRESIAHCQACGSNKPDTLFGVKSQNGIILLVGSKCLSILTSAKNPKVDSVLVNTGEVYSDGTKEYIYITEEWLNKVEAFNVISRYTESNQPKYVKNDFIHNVYMQAKQYKKITVKQYQAVNKILEG